MIDLRLELIDSTRQLIKMGLNKGASGNCSARNEDGFLITPTGLTVDQIYSDQIVQMDINGKVVGPGNPSSEWRFHHDIYLAHPEVQAVIHTHSPYATAFSCLRIDLPPFHYMIAMAGGDTIRCAPYALFGTPELANNALVALENRQACLLANHGMIVIGADLASALARAVEVETLCEMYWRTLQGGQPKILSPEQMQAVHQQFIGYGSLGQSQKISVKK